MPDSDALYLGIDVGSVSTNLILIDDHGQIHYKEYLRTQGQPIPVVQGGLAGIARVMPGIQIKAVGTTGSGRQLAGAIVGADIVKNEITAHAVAATHFQPDVQTVIEIGGQDSKIIILREGVVTDFAMNTVCAAGTGSFLDQQANRLNLSISELGAIALRSKHPVRIAGRCSVFAESDMIHKQQMGHSLEDIVAGLCEALVRNYLNNVGKGKEIWPPVLFQGGVAANAGIKRAFEKEFGFEIIIPQYYDTMGAWGVALLAKEEQAEFKKSSFRGIKLCEDEIEVASFECPDCPNRCEVVTVLISEHKISGWGDRCGKWQRINTKATG
ncbi:MAG TPA: 2-hydroxyglutaryl-CoA dehydratase [Firmicutes bacterium]|nr:2-hydroxyglutaryl-CoA dehydratase [Bacillota bacterium]